MPEEKLPTRFLSAEKADPAEIARHHKIFASAPEVAAALNGMLNFSLILNLQRQAVFVNGAFSEFLSNHGITEIIGQRPGNLAGCMHSTETAGGCGTTESCRRCGAALAIEQALNAKESEMECRIISKKIGEDLDLFVKAGPYAYGGEQFLLISLMDISAKKRREALEAVKAGSVITISCRKTESGAAFLVHNPGQMPDESRLQVFQRSFSTKGAGRGQGTYSIRLLTEKYLKGKVSFTTGPGGTEFKAEYPVSLSRGFQPGNALFERRVRGEQ